LVVEDTALYFGTYLREGRLALEQIAIEQILSAPRTRRNAGEPAILAARDQAAVFMTAID
jgi:hypothetical protein